jgi:hypothetical protein
MNADTHRIDCVDRELGRWLVEQARAGVPELVLLVLLRSYAERIERHSCIPRAWGHLNPTESTERRYAR